MRTMPVLIVGGGPVGLALAAELGWRGIACTMIEQGDGSIVTPKMNEVNVRSMEFCRRWGIADDVHNCPFPTDHPRDAVFVTSMAGYELGRLPRPARMGQKPDPWSPMRLQTCSQMWFDPILQRFARSFPHVTLRYRTRLESFEDTGSGVTAELVDLESGARERVTADYLVGCDGATSAIRGVLGIDLVGQGTLGHPLHLFFKTPDLLQRCGKPLGSFFLHIDHDGLWANVRVIDPVNGIWRLMVLDSDGKQTPETVDRDALLRRAIGKQIEVEWLGVSIWTRRSLVAERYSKGRIFLAGDAVHQLSPTGALGMNTGLGDAVDLGWKLAAVLEGWGGPDLLESYNAERQPIGMRNITKTSGFFKAHQNFHESFGAIADDSDEGRALRERLGPALVRDVGAMFRTIGLQIGYRYEGSPICVADGTSEPPDEPENYVASARPGARAPHAVLADGRSTLDLYGRGLVLLRLGADAPDATAFEKAAADRGVPLKTVALNEPDAIALYERRLVLVRPDGHVAWRADKMPADPSAIVDAVRGERVSAGARAAVA